MNEESTFEKQVRAQVYDITMREGVPPLAARVADALQATPREVLGAFASLAERRMLVVQADSGEVLMANPFSAVPTPFVVIAEGVKTYGNCIWDALGIAAMLKRDVDIDTSCGDCGASMQGRVRGDRAEGDGILHFAIPARLWWKDIVFN
jgi:hypothetical protein